MKENRLNISKIILFGSQATETTDNSDVDILIISDDFKNKDIFERARLTKDAEIKTIRKFMVPLDIITLTSEEFENETSPVAEFAKSGKVMFAA
ncbi:MAG: nucleotidyltransferase domain-containing protein [ANME-2 cluster archaeon]|nr:nucleotidyltransferase domain-containing protein [ANME-2 cluster archaeon]